jgi:phosphomannomutase
MTASHNRRYWNTLYMYEDSLLWVWHAWGAAIIIYSLIQVQVRNPSESPTIDSTSLPEQISVWGCIHMTASHNRRYWNTLYMYEDNLLWVWSGWGAAIIIYSLIQVRNPSESPTTDSTSLPEQILVWGCIHMTASHNRRYWNALYMYEVDLLWVWSGWDAAIIIYSLIQVRNRVNHLVLLILHLSQSRYQCGVASIWLPATKNVLKHFIYV